jgi:DNA-binding FrmR family transcriptional regulator
MIEEDRYCADVLMQLSSVQEALRGVGRSLLHNHLKYCVTEAIRSHDPEQADAMYEELMELMYKNAR